MPDRALDVLQLEGIQVPRSGPRPLAHRLGRRRACLEGFSLHADTWLHENDVVGLEWLCNDGARGPLSLERLSALPDGRLAYRMKRASATEQTHLVMAPVAFLRRVAAGNGTALPSAAPSASWLPRPTPRWPDDRAPRPASGPNARFVLPWISK